MKVKELIEELNKLPEEQKELSVLTEGCDCLGGASGIRIIEDKEEKESFLVVIRDGMQLD